MKHQPIYVCTVVRPNLMALPVPSVPVEPIARARMRQSTHDGGAKHDGGCKRHGYHLPCSRCEGFNRAMAMALPAMTFRGIKIPDFKLKLP